MEKRIHSASHVLDSSLGRYFVDGLQHRDETAIYNCLRAYAALDNTSSTEEIFRTTILAPLVGKELKHSPSELAAETSGNELQQNYQLIKQYVENNFKFLQEISSRGEEDRVFAAENEGAQKRTGASSDVADESISNTDKICMQLFLDIQEHGHNLASLGVDVAKIPAYQSLWQCVAPADISF